MLPLLPGTGRSLLVSLPCMSCLQSMMMLSLAFVCAACASANPSISFARSYGDHMVLASAPKQASVWGFMTKVESQSLQSGAGSHVVEVVVGSGVPILADLDAFNTSHSTWRAVLPAMPPTAVHNSSGTYDADPGVTITVTVSASANNGVVAEAILNDVLFGEVWVCSGQSNMAFLVENAFDGDAEVQKANQYSAIRFMTTAKITSKSALVELPSPSREVWSISSNESISDDGKSGENDDDWLYMSAVCYFYGQRIFEGLGAKVPVGLVNTNWGGTDIESWSSPDALARCPGSNKTDGSVRYNAMISPLLNMTISGWVWYQVCRWLSLFSTYVRSVLCN